MDFAGQCAFSKKRHQWRRHNLCILFIALLFAACLQRSDHLVVSISLAVPYEIDTLDPHQRSKLSSFAVLSHFYEPLIITGADMAIEPCLAQSWENPDLLTWVFHLRHPVHFHSGKLMTAEDVVYTLQRVLAHPKFERAPYVSNVMEVAAINQYSVRVKTIYPTAILLNKLSFIPIVPKGSTIEALSHAEDGTGPYRLKYWDTRKNVIAMVLNENYWNTKPPIKEATFVLGQNDQSGIQKLLSGECTFFQGSSRSAENAVKSDSRFRVEHKDSLYIKYLGFNFRNKDPEACPLPNDGFRALRLREAIDYAIDRSRLIASLNNYAFPITQVVPPFTFGFNPELQSPPHNPEQAKTLLQESGFTDDFRPILLVRKIMEQSGFIVQQQLAEIGLRVQLTVLPDSQFFQQLEQGKFCMFLSRFGSPTGDASDILESAFHTYSPELHYGELNHGRYSNPDLDKAILESSEIQQLDRRKTRLQEIMAILNREKVWLPLYGDQDIYVYDSSFSWKPRIDSLIDVSEITPR